MCIRDSQCTAHARRDQGKPRPGTAGCGSGIPDRGPGTGDHGDHQPDQPFILKCCLLYTSEVTDDNPTITGKTAYTLTFKGRANETYKYQELDAQGTPTGNLSLIHI